MIIIRPTNIQLKQLQIITEKAELLCMLGRGVGLDEIVVNWIFLSNFLDSLFTN
jgi:hypothetical protein